MARKPRIQSPTGYYHIMTRGINREIIFKNSKDKIKYLYCIKDAKKKFNLKIICYCLMSNHTHLVLYDEDFVLSNFMKSLNCKYAAYFNNKYDRIGSLFQDRFNIVDASIISDILGDEKQHRSFIESFNDDHFIDV